MKLRNKLMGLALAAAMVVSAAVGLTPVTAHAASTQVSLVPQKTEVKAGETVVVDVVLSGNTGMCYLDMDFTYNKDAFKLVSVVDKGLLPEYLEANEGDLIWQGFSSNVKKDGTLATLTFTAKTTEGTFDFGLVVNECYDTATNDVAITAKGGKVTIAHEHKFGAWTETTAPTCSKAGVETRTCACGEKETREVAATGNHTYGEWKETVAPTCEKAGEKVKECTCGDKVKETIPATGHTYGEEKEDPATCDKAGSKYKECACGHKEVTETIPALGHLDVDGDGICDDCHNEMPKQPVEDDKDDNKEDNKEDAKGDKEDAKEDGKKDESSNPATGDATSIMVWVALMVAAAVVIFNKKRINA